MGSAQGVDYSLLTALEKALGILGVAVFVFGVLGVMRRANTGGAIVRWER